MTTTTTQEPFEVLSAWREEHPTANHYASNTKVFGPFHEGVPCFHVQYHETVILRVYADRLVFNTGGWKTPTTRDRMNKFMPTGCRIIQRKGIWYMDNSFGHTEIADRFDLVKTVHGWSLFNREMEGW